MVEFKQKQDIKNQKLSESITTFIGQKDTILKKQITKIKNEYSTKIENLNRVNHVLQQEVMSLQNQIEIKDLELEKLKTSVHEFDRVSRDLHTQNQIKTREIFRKKTEEFIKISKIKHTKYQNIINKLQREIDHMKGRRNKSIRSISFDKHRYKSMIKKNKKIQKSLFQDLTYLIELVSTNIVYQKKYFEANLQKNKKEIEEHQNHQQKVRKQRLDGH